MILSNLNTRTISVWLLGVIVLGCSAILILINGCVEDEEECCCETEGYTTTELLLHEMSPMGFSAAQILDSIIGKRNTTFRWRDGSETEATVEITFDSVHIEHHGYEYTDMECIENGDRYPSSLGSEFDIDKVFAWCDKLVFNPVRVSLKTDDGSFDEVWETTGVAFESREVYLLTQMVNPSSIRGDYQIPKEKQAPNQSLSIVVNYQDGSMDGTVSVVEVPDKIARTVEVPDKDTDDAGVVFATGFWLVGCWGSCEFCQDEYGSCEKR